MPRILTQVIDTVNREEKNVTESHGQVRSVRHVGEVLCLFLLSQPISSLVNFIELLKP